MRKLYFTLLLSLLLINLCSANLGTFKLNECVDIKTILNTSSVKLSTLNFPLDGGIIASNQPMQNIAGKTWNYTTCNTTELGIYDYDYFDAEGNTYVNSFEITNSGSLQTTSQGLGSIAFILLLFGLMLLFGYVGWKLLNSDLLWAAGALFIVLALLMMIYSVWLVYEFKLNYTGSSPDATVPEVIFYIFMTILVCGLMTAGILIFTKWREVSKKFKAALKPEEDSQDLI